jgi:multisubunit Na+/H+ antiporter MnhF subunit
MLISGTIVYVEAIFARHTTYANAMALTALIAFIGSAVIASFGREKRGIEFGRSAT